MKYKKIIFILQIQNINLSKNLYSFVHIFYKTNKKQLKIFIEDVATPNASSLTIDVSDLNLDINYCKHASKYSNMNIAIDSGNLKFTISNASYNATISSC